MRMALRLLSGGDTGGFMRNAGIKAVAVALALIGAVATEASAASNACVPPTGPSEDFYGAIPPTMQRLVDSMIPQWNDTGGVCGQTGSHCGIKNLFVGVAGQGCAACHKPEEDSNTAE